MITATSPSTTLDDISPDALEVAWQEISEYYANSNDAKEGALAFLEKRAPDWDRTGA